MPEMPSRSEIKQEVLSRAGGCCEECHGDLGHDYHIHYQGYPVFHPDNLTVLCNNCHSVLMEKRRQSRPRP